jgi:hypothetical protein
LALHIPWTLKLVPDDGMSATERTRLHAAIREGLDEIQAGGGSEMSAFLDELEAEPLNVHR